MYVGNLPFSATAEDITSLFSEYGTVTDVFLPIDRDSGRPRGFAFVTMDSTSAMEAAIRGQNGQDFGGRNLAINEARPKEERPGGGGGLGGALGGLAEKVGGAAGIMGLVEKSGLSMDQAGGFVSSLVAWLKEKAGGGIIEKIVSQVPALKSILG